MMDETTSLDEALGEPVETPQEPTPEPETETPAETTAETTEPEGSTPEPEETWTKAAVMDERSKRQAMETELSEAKQMLAQFQGYYQAQQQTTQQEQPKAPNFWEDPEKAIGYMQETLRGEFTNKLSAVESGHKNAILNMSEQMIAQNFDDFADVKAHALKMAESNPAIIQQAAQSNPTHPWMAVYQHAKKDMELQQVGDLDSYKAKLKEELKAEALAEVKAELEASNQKLGSVPTSLVNQTSKGGLNPQAWAGPTSLDSLIGD